METEALDYEASFDAAFESALAGDTEADQPTVESGESAAGDTGAEKESGETGAEQTAEQQADQPVGEGEAAKPEASDVYHLKWMDEVKDVNRDEVVQLAQKGLDYDRIREDRERLKASVSELEKYRAENAELIEDLQDFMAENSLENVSEVLDAMRVAKLTQKGTQRDLAIEQVKRGRVERALARAQKQAEQKKESEQKESKAEADVKAFLKEHPDENLKDLLPKLEKDLAETGDLEKAYLRYSLREARKEAAAAAATARAEKQNADAKRRSGGSMQSAGGGSDGVAEAMAKIVLSDD